MDVGCSLVGFEQPRALEPWVLKYGGLSPTSECRTAPRRHILLEWAKFPVVVPLTAPTRSWEWGFPLEWGGPSTKKGFPILEAFPIVSPVSERVLRRCSKLGPNSCRPVSEKCYCANETIKGLTFFRTSSLRLLISEQLHLRLKALHVLCM